MRKKTAIAILIAMILLFLIPITIYLILASQKYIQKQMIDYYSNDDNYTYLSGEVVKLKEDIIYVNIITENSDFKMYVTNDLDFILYANNNLYDIIFVGDIVTFCSAPEYFYDSYILPIVYLEKEETVYLTFEEGKNNLLNWIDENINF